jgi:hypothetical protein
MTSSSRKYRGNRTQALVAQWYRDHGLVHAMSAGSGRPGRDILEAFPLCIEVKARTGLDPLAWARQNNKEARDGETPFVVFRCNGQGEDVGEYFVLRQVKHDTQILREAGYLPDERLPE